jgi:hypothetical protein
MIIQRTDPRFWDVRVVDRRIRRSEISRADLDAHLGELPDVAERSTPSVPLDEPEARVRERRPLVKVSPPISRLGADKSLDDDLDDDLIDDLDDDEDDDDEDDLDDEIEDAK